MQVIRKNIGQVQGRSCGRAEKKPRGSSADELTQRIRNAEVKINLSVGSRGLHVADDTTAISLANDSQGRTIRRDMLMYVEAKKFADAGSRSGGQREDHALARKPPTG